MVGQGICFGVAADVRGPDAVRKPFPAIARPSFLVALFLTFAHPGSPPSANRFFSRGDSGGTREGFHEGFAALPGGRLIISRGQETCLRRQVSVGEARLALCAPCDMP